MGPKKKIKQPAAVMTSSDEDDSLNIGKQLAAMGRRDNESRPLAGAVPSSSISILDFSPLRLEKPKETKAKRGKNVPSKSTRPLPMVAGSSGANVTEQRFLRRIRSVSSDNPGTSALALSDHGIANRAPGRSVSQRTNHINSRSPSLGSRQRNQPDTNDASGIGQGLPAGSQNKHGNKGESFPQRRRKTTKPKKRVDQEIKRLQNSSSLIIPKLPFQRLVREITQKYSKDMKFTVQAMAALQESTEYAIVQYFQTLVVLMTGFDRVTLMPKDMLVLGAIMECADIHWPFIKTTEQL
ncbi:histone H3.v1-like [Symsagittifera roscoffensis]|uniref:histone H3.v1-like n=1 Tax=Symsagittifera roscoffensis TaxID=84072 RepID=UPI00307CAD6E